MRWIGSGETKIHREAARQRESKEAVAISSGWKSLYSAFKKKIPQYGEKEAYDLAVQSFLERGRMKGLSRILWTLFKFHKETAKSYPTLKAHFLSWAALKRYLPQLPDLEP
jgi:hypothetical protein